MAESKLTQEDLDILQSKIGLKYLMAQEKIDIHSALKFAHSEHDLRKIQEKLIPLHEWIIETKQQVIVVFEGRDAAGKSSAIRRITAHINPRHFQVVALPKPTEDERLQWYFQRYINAIPSPGTMVFFDRSWYNRAILEPVHGFCTEKEYESFMKHVNDFEHNLRISGVILIKIYFSITKEEQAKRIEILKEDPLKKWTLTDLDFKAQELWDEHGAYESRMLSETDTNFAPWKTIDANYKPAGRVEALNYIVDRLEEERSKLDHRKAEK